MSDAPEESSPRSPAQLARELVTAVVLADDASSVEAVLDILELPQDQLPDVLYIMGGLTRIVLLRLIENDTDAAETLARVMSDHASAF